MIHGVFENTLGLFGITLGVFKILFAREIFRERVFIIILVAISFI